jgi:hypothetical protein
MADRWLCLIDGQKIGPVKFSRLKQLAEAGRLRAHDYVRPEDQEQWSSAHEIADLIPSPAVTPETAETQPDAHPLPEKRRHSGSLPVARSVEDTVAVPKLKRAMPVGTAVAPPPVTKSVGVKAKEGSGEFPLFVAKDDHTGTHGESTAHGHGRKPKKSSALPLMIGGGAVAGVLGLLLILVLSGVIDLSGSNNEVAASAPPNKSKPGVETAVPEDEEEANPEDANAEADVAKTKKVGKVDAKDSLLKSVKQFRDVTKIKNIGIPPAVISFTGIWLSASENGEPFVADGAQQATPKYLVLKVKIDNAPGAAPMAYKGWGNEAVLFDEADKAIQPLPPSGSRDRIAKQRIEPGGSLTDTLIFPLDSLEFDKLRLALPHETVGIKDSASFGLELPRHALGRGLDTQVAGGADPAINARKTSDEGKEEIIDTTPVSNDAPMANSAPAPMPEKPAPKPKNDDDDFLRKLDERAKMLDKMEKEKGKK